MNLQRTLNNLVKSKEGFFNIKSNSVVCFDIYKENLMVIKINVPFQLTNTKQINKHFINWECDYSKKKIIPSTTYNFWFQCKGYDIPFHKDYQKYYVKNRLIRTF